MSLYHHLTSLWNRWSQGLSFIQRNAVDTEECLGVCGGQGVLYMPLPALIGTIVFILSNLTELQSDEFKLSHLHTHCAVGELWVTTVGVWLVDVDIVLCYCSVLMLQKTNKQII